jgi:hypothetical protein
MQEKTSISLELVKYRDAGMHTYTYFWVDKNYKVYSPYFNSEDEAQDWLNTAWDNWKSIK